MVNPEVDKASSASAEGESRFVVGAGRSPDGTPDFSKAAVMREVRSDLGGEDKGKDDRGEFKPPHLVVGAQRGPDGRLNYAKAATMRPPETFFGSVRGAEVDEIAKKMMQDEGSKLAGGMLDQVISLALSEPDMDRDEVVERLMDEHVGSEKARKKAAAEAMRYFGDLKQIRDAVLEQRRKSAN